jgi:hypothetical protein
LRLNPFFSGEAYCKKAQFYGKRGIAGARVFGVGMEKTTIAEDHMKYFMQCERQIVYNFKVYLFVHILAQIIAIFEGCVKCKKGQKVTLKLFHLVQEVT